MASKTIEAGNLKAGNFLEVNGNVEHIHLPCERTMSFNDPDSCWFAKVAAYNIVSSLNDHESRYEKYGLLFAELENFRVSYKQFNENTY